MAYKSQSSQQALLDFYRKFPQDATIVSELTDDGDEPNMVLEGNWVGQEKTRYDFVLKYLSSNSTARGYNVYSFQDRNYNRFLAFLDCETISIGPDCEPLAIGDCFSCKATVNRHGINTYKYGKRNPFKETVLNRIKFKSWLGPSGQRAPDG